MERELETAEDALETLDGADDANNDGSAVDGVDDRDAEAEKEADTPLGDADQNNDVQTEEMVQEPPGNYEDDRADVEQEIDDSHDVKDDVNNHQGSEQEAPLAKPERDSGLNVPPPSPSNGKNEDDDTKILMNDDYEPEKLQHTKESTPSQEDSVFIESEIHDIKSSTPKKEKKEKKEKKVKKEKKEKKEKTKEEKPPKESSLPLDQSSKRIHLNWTIPAVYKSSLVKLLCGLYALIVVVLGIVFATSTSLTSKERSHKYYLEVFLVYLYTGSLIVLLYFQLGLLRGVKVKNSYFDTNIKVSIRPDGSIQKSPSATPTPHRAHEVLADDVTLENGRGLEEISLASRHSQLVLPANGGVAHVGEGINFYLRLGALAFAFGSVTLDGLHIASYFESPELKTCDSEIFIFVYVMHLFFTFVQTFFLFKNHKLVIDKQKALVRFGMMHIMATNLCVLLVTVIAETAEDFRQEDFIKRNITGGPLKSCYEEITLARSASPYLFPCTVIYSIIGAGIVYRLYQYVGVKVRQRWPSHTSLTSSVPQGATGIDCDKANKGLFMGLLVAVLTLIAIATFFVFENRISDSSTAVQVFYVTEIALMVVTGAGIIWGYARLATLKFLPSNFLSVDSVLLIVALSGSYIYLFFILISVLSSGELGGAIGILSVITIVLGLVQITLQIVFILDGLCRCAENDGQMADKPGRSVVTFLLVCNLAMWVVSMFEIKKTQVILMHERFYGILAWNIITHLCVPLMIFFRFHSAICLSKIWYKRIPEREAYVTRLKALRV
ncbi:hypothetical protein DPMN_115274 [Dreissena polymorpha]|uniref:Uncharacterized protein n=1 Tax=Dreissena polymorpha TaxID=45954 RepID=A0A9D4KLN0_DREPO|nr:hypothetical protein DPMN_115274 [Dreissena polymorpha]